MTVAASETTVSTETDTYTFQMKEIALSMIAGSKMLVMTSHAVEITSIDTNIYDFTGKTQYLNDLKTKVI